MKNLIIRHIKVSDNIRLRIEFNKETKRVFTTKQTINKDGYVIKEYGINLYTVDRL